MDQKICDFRIKYPGWVLLLVKFLTSAFFSLFFAFFRFFSLNFHLASIFSLNFRLFYLRFRFRFLVFRIEVNHVKTGFFFASKRNEIFTSISNFASEAKVRAHPTWDYINRSHTHECGIRAEAALFPEKEYISGIFVAAWNEKKHLALQMTTVFPYLVLMG